jgi:molybdopterin-guanine dinucleotide biosynthesis protein A
MGADKASTRIGDATLLDHSVARFAPPGTTVVVSIGSRALAVPDRAITVLDHEPGLGPLAGMTALLAKAPAPFMLIVPIDLPLFPAGCGDAMAAALQGAHAVALGWKGRTEPFPALVSRDLAPLFNDLLRRGLRRADAFHDHARCRVVPFADLFPGRNAETAFLNVNTPEDLARAEALLASEGT